MASENEKNIYVRLVLQHHFGVRNLDGETVCGTCAETPWPCAPARLADLVKKEIES